MIINEAVILAGGKGTRLKSMLNGLPKPLLKINGIPLIERQINHLIDFGIEKVFLMVNFNSFEIKKFINSKNFKIKFEIIEDGNEPLGTAGSILNHLQRFSKNFFVIYGDTLFNIDFKKFSNFHLNENPFGISIFIHPNDHPYDSDIVEVLGNKVIKIHPYPHASSFYKSNLVNAALYIINKSSLLGYKFEKKNIDFAKNLFNDASIISKIKAYKSFEYIKDCGTPDRVKKVNKHLINGVYEKSILTKKQKIIYLDRDGTLIENVNHLKSIDQIKIFDKASDALKKINSNGDRAIVITNQPVVARGEIDEVELKNIHNYIEWELGKKNVFIDEIYYCPHHPDKGFKGENLHYKIKCSCRKPGTKLLNESLNKFNTDIDNSWFVGDTTTDIKTAYNFGLKSILVRTGFSGHDNKYKVDPDFIMNDVGDAVDFIYNDYKKLFKICKQNNFEKFNGRLISVSGQSRSGKSTFSRVLFFYLKSKGLSPKLISLDKFLLSRKFRGKKIYEKYSISEIKKFIDCLKSNKKFTLKNKFYDKISGNILETKKILTINPNDIVILEGLIANYFDFQNKLSIFLKLDEEVRKKRFMEEYSSRNFNHDTIVEMYNTRLKNEFLEIKNLIKKSNLIINL